MLKNLSFLAAILLMLSITSCSEENDEVLPAAEVELKARLNGQDNSGWNGGKFWTMYNKNNQGWVNISFPRNGGSMEIEYKGNSDVVGGKGWKNGTTGRKINYNIGYLSGQYAFVGVYGWVKKGGEIIEYYVNERKNGWNGGSIGGENLNKNFTANNKTYRFIRNGRYAEHAYGGGKTNFTQFISENFGNVPTNSTQSVSMSRHFQQWGWDGGVGGNWNNHLYQVFGIENFRGNWGKINATVW